MGSGRVSSRGVPCTCYRATPSGQLLGCEGCRGPLDDGLQLGDHASPHWPLQLREARAWLVRYASDAFFLYARGTKTPPGASILAGQGPTACHISHLGLFAYTTAV